MGLLEETWWPPKWVGLVWFQHEKLTEPWNMDTVCSALLLVDMNTRGQQGKAGRHMSAKPVIAWSPYEVVAQRFSPTSSFEYLARSDGTVLDANE